MKLAIKAPRRLRPVLLAVATLLLTAPALLSNGPGLFPGAVLASGSDFSLSGTVANLAPGATSTLALTVDNPQNVQLTVTQVTVTVSTDPSSCSALTNLTLNNAAFTGSPPAVTISASPLPQTVPAKSGINDGTAIVSLPIVVARGSGNGCQSTAFPFTYSAKASYTASTTSTLTSTPNPSNFGQPANFTGTVTASPSSANPAAGSLTFYRCTSPSNLATGSPASACTSSVALGAAQALDASGQATLSTSSLPAGSWPIYSVYTPTDVTSFSGSSSSTITQTVGFTQPCITAPVNGGYTVSSGQSICLSGSGRVNGGVTVQPGGSLYLSGGTVNGGLNANHSGAITICGASINGGATITAASGFVMLGDGGDDGSPACAANSINGGVSITNGTGSFEVGANSISGGATFSGNTGSGPFGQDATPEIEGNHITGGLTCTTNNPAPINGGQPNTVSGSRSGQCSAGGF
jgi:hypothetical protein